MRNYAQICPRKKKYWIWDEADKYAEDGHPLTCIGKEYIRTKVVMERAKIRVIKHYRQVYADREYEQRTGNACIRKPEPIPPLIPHSYASASIVTDVLVKKYADGLPLYRQEQMWKRMGVALSRGMLANWIICQWAYLCCFASHGEVEISNNQVENAIRPFVVGRKGWLFADTPEGAEATAIHFSIMETAKANGLNVETYVQHQLSVLPERFAASNAPYLNDLLPWSLE